MSLEDVKEILFDNFKNSYSPYSDFKVSAVLLTDNGKVYTGVNIENASYGATICAERVALSKAISEGEKNFKKLYLSAQTKDGKHPLIYPCGICRQFISEFSKDLDIVIISDDGILNTNIKELLPSDFDDTYL